MDHKIILYTTGCPRCSVLKKKLDVAEINYVAESNVEKIVEVVDKFDLPDEVPLLQVSTGSVLTFAEAIKWIEENK